MLLTQKDANFLSMKRDIPYGTLPEHSFLFMLIPDNYFNFIPTIPFPSKKSFHSKKTLMFLDYFKGLFQDVLLFFECGLIFCFLNLLWDCLLCC